MYVETVECMSSAGSEYMLECKKFYCCWIVFYVEDSGVSSAECHVHLVGVIKGVSSR